MTTLLPLAPLCRASNQSGYNRILLRHLSTRKLLPHNFNKRKLLNLKFIRTKPIMNSYSTDRVLTLENMNQAVIKLEYAVRGPLVLRAQQIQKELNEKVTINFSISFCFLLLQTLHVKIGFLFAYQCLLNINL